MQDNSDYSKKMVIIVLGVAALLIGVATISYAYINKATGDNNNVLINGYIIGNTNINLTFNTVDNTSNLSYTVNTANLSSNKVDTVNGYYDTDNNAQVHIQVNLDTTNYDYSYDAINNNVICEYSIYYYPTTSWTPSTGVTEDKPELTLYFTNGVDDYNVSLDNVSTATPILNTIINAGVDNKTVSTKWTFQYRFYNLALNQDEAVGKNVSGYIGFKSVENGCRVS